MCMVYPEEICRLCRNSADVRETLQTFWKLCRLQETLRAIFRLLCMYCINELLYRK